MTINMNQLEEYKKLLEELARRKRIEQFKNDLMGFGEYYFQGTQLMDPPTPSPEFHKILSDEIQDALWDKERGHFIAVAAPRSHAKSIRGTVISTIYTVVNKICNYVLIISAKQDIAAQLLSIIKHQLMTNEKLINDYGDMYDKTVWNNLQIVCKNGVKVQAAGAGDSLRGLNHLGSRPGVIYIDDLEKDPDVESPSYREQMRQWLNSVAIPLGTPGKTHVIYVGTILHPDSVLNYCLTDPSSRFDKKMIFSAIQKWPDRMDLWEQWKEILLTRVADADDEEDAVSKSAEKAERFYKEHEQEMLAGAKVLWPERMSLYELMRVWATQRRSFLTEYQQTPRDESTALFTNFTYYDQLPPLDEMDIYGSVDPSLGKTSRADPSCIITIGKHKKTGVIYVIDVNTKRRSPDAIITDILRLASIYDYKLFAVESVAFQEFFQQQLQTRAQLEGVYLPVKSVKPLNDKKLRISSLEPFITNGLIRFGRHHVNLVDELKDFPSGNHDDQCDALEMACALTFKQKRQLVFDAW